jgi:hypothetical protein
VILKRGYLNYIYFLNFSTISYWLEIKKFYCKTITQQGISYLERAREGGEREAGVGGRVSRQSHLRLG